MMTPLHSSFSAFIQGLREFFLSQDMVEIYCPPLTDLPCMETHLQPLKLSSASTGSYLFTSPEFYLKEILLTEPTENLKKGIFSFAYSFRNDPESPLHRKCFLMLEWYLIDQDFDQLQNFVKEMLPENLKKNLKQITVQQSMKHHTGIDFLMMKDSYHWKEKLKKKYPHLISQLSEDLSWDDYFHLLFLNEVEPHFKKFPALLLSNYPEQCRALAKLTFEDRPTAKRVELFINGTEVGNGYEECTDYEDYASIYQKVVKEKSHIYQQNLNPNIQEITFFKKLFQKNLPKCSGMAIGVERLFQALKNNHFFTSNF